MVFYTAGSVRGNLGFLVAVVNAVHIGPSEVSLNKKKKTVLA